jgi:hypothetical protein
MSSLSDVESMNVTAPRSITTPVPSTCAPTAEDGGGIVEVELAGEVGDGVVPGVHRTSAMSPIRAILDTFGS